MLDRGNTRANVFESILLLPGFLLLDKSSVDLRSSYFLERLSTQCMRAPLVFGMMAASSAGFRWLAQRNNVTNKVIKLIRSAKSVL